MDLGIDLTYIPRFSNKEKLAKKVLSKAEYEAYILSKNKEQFLASRWCLKEAYIKLKEGNILSQDLSKIEIVKKENGAVFVQVGDEIFKASLSHEKDYCIGVVYR